MGDSCESRDEGKEITGKWQYRKDSRILPYRRPVRPLSCLVEFWLVLVDLHRLLRSELPCRSDDDDDDDGGRYRVCIREDMS